MNEKDFYMENGLRVRTESYLKKKGYCCDCGCRHCPYEFTNNDISIISMVPSLTETLIELGINVLGRTRYCIHPIEKVKSIQPIGGTKKANYTEINNIKADYVLMDKQENPKEFDDKILHKKIITDVTSLDHLRSELIDLNKILNNKKLNNLIKDIKKIQKLKFKLANLKDLSGVQKWINPIGTRDIKNILYVIWRDPWMVVSKDTYIGSVLSEIGLEDKLLSFDKHYPEIDLKDYSPEGTLLLFSSEPFPFEKHIDELKKLPFSSALVNGESFSWFGVRSVEFLKNIKF